MKPIKFKIPRIEELNNRLKRIESILETVQKTNPLTGIWLNSKEAAKAIGVTTRTLQTYRDQGSISFSQFGREIRYRAKDIQGFLMSHYVESKYQKGGRS